MHLLFIYFCFVYLQSYWDHYLDVNPFNLTTFTHSADPEETAHNEQSHQDLHCLTFWFWFLNQTPVCNNGCVQSK